LRTVSPDWQDATRILCVRLDTLGDVLMTSPAMRAFKESLAGSHITLLTSTAGAEAAPFIPEVDEVMVYESPWMKSSPVRAGSQFDLAMLQDLHQRQFDAAVIFTVYSQNPLPSALFCYLADIPLRLAHCRENPYKLLTHWVQEIEPEQTIRHEVQRQLDLAAAVGCSTQDVRLSFRVTDEMRAEAARAISAAGVNLSRPWVALHPGVSAPSRQYRPEGYAQAARQLALEDGFQVVLTGTEGERELAEQIQREMGVPSFSLAGQLGLGGMGALLEMAPLLISNNTGPVHIAAALGTPVVDLYALTNPQHTPWAVPHRVLNHDVPCKFCYKSICPEGHHNCLRLVEPRAIVQAVRELLAENPVQPRSQLAKP
jgi:lipopolysaccharide heptosyltransferase II